MLGKTVAVLALAASCLVTGSPPSFAGRTTAALAAQGQAGVAHGKAEAVKLMQSGHRLGVVPGGTQLWVTRYDGTAKDENIATAMAVSPDGSEVFVTGYTSYPKTGYRHDTTVAYDAATGTQLWVARYYAPNNSESDSVTVSPDGSRVFITGSATVAYNAATGARLWVRGSSSGVAIVVNPTGSAVWVTGGNVTAAYNAATGARIWVRRYFSAKAPGGTSANAMAISPDGSRLFVTGMAKAATHTAYLTVGYDAANGSRLWAHLYYGKRPVSIASSVAVSPDESTVFVTGTSSGPTQRGRYVTLAYAAATGTRKWVAATADNTDMSRFATLAVSPDGSEVFVTGKGGSTRHYDTTDVVLAYNAVTGALLWMGSVGMLPEAITVSPDGSEVFVTGTARVGLRFYLQTTAYGAGGGWTQQYAWPVQRPDSFAVSVVASSNGSEVFVTGYGAKKYYRGPSGYATVAYSP